MFPPKDVPLRNDVNTLGSLLGEVLQEQGGPELLQRVEAARLAARGRRQGEVEADEALTAQLRGMPTGSALELVRAFSAYFGLVNLAERVHRIRRRRDYLREGSAEPQPGGLVAVLRTLRDRGVEAAQLHELLAHLEVTPVFTAHPTEATRRSLLTKEQRMARSLVDRLVEVLPVEEDAALARIRHEVTTAWQTEELSTAPTVADEVEHVVFYLTEVIYRIVPVFYEGLADAVQAVYGAPLPPLSKPLVRFGSWVGGDMDGNPNVGAATIRATLTRHRALILKRYVAEVRELFEHLSQSRSRIQVDPALEQRIIATQRLLPDETILERYRDMPYRVLLWLMSRRLEATEADKINGYSGPNEFASDLQLILGSLQQHRGGHAGAFRVQRLLWRVQTFGFHLATLDIRQDSLVHRRVVGELLGVADYLDKPAKERAALLQAALAKPMPELPVAPPGSEMASTLDVMHSIATCRQRFGSAAIGPYIISMCQGPDDVLALLYLARRAGLVDDAGQVALDIAPLFETVPDLQAAPATLEAMLGNGLYRDHIRLRGDRHLVMLGYSDSNKESGLAASRWALQEAQVALVRVAEQAKVTLTLFHGRGGTASRGGSKPRAAIIAEPPGTVRGRLRLTEQGEIIHSKYGLRDIALRTLELMGGAVLEVTAGSVGAPPKPEWLQAMQCIAQKSRAVFRAMVYDDADFFAYFTAATPIDVIGRLRIGSRPAARRAQKGIQDLRAIPWVFSWTQNRQMLPGWYGVGSGLQEAAQRFGLETLQAMAAGWPFFANLIADTEMVLAKADLPIGKRYAALAGAIGERIWPCIEAEFRSTCDFICQIQKTQELLDREPVLQRAIRLRNPYVDPMSLLQVDLLQRWRAGDRQDTELERALLTTVKGIARGLQNTG